MFSGQTFSQKCFLVKNLTKNAFNLKNKFRFQFRIKKIDSKLFSEKLFKLKTFLNGVFDQKKLFSAKNDSGWNGTINGQVQNNGIYVWILLVTDKQGILIMRKGTVALIR